MADNRYNQIPPGYHGGPQMVQGAGLTNVTGMRGPYMQPNMPMNPMMQQQMMMRFPMQGMRMGPPNTPPPPYSAHQPPGVLAVNTPRVRASLSKSKGAQKSDKERFLEEQRQKMKQFGKPGAMKVDTDSLIGSMFKVDAKPPVHRSGGNSIQNVTEEDGFGDFLQGPSYESSNMEHMGDNSMLADSNEEASEPSDVQMEEKKDLTSMMMECSDMSAPQKAKGFHKPTLNEVHKSRGRDHPRKSSFHESDHSRSWKNAEDLDGLFQIPVQPKPAPVPVQQPAPFTAQQMPPQAANAFLAMGQTPPQNGAILASGPMTMSYPPNANMNTGPVPIGHPSASQPTGPPPPYSETSVNSSSQSSSSVTMHSEPANQMPISSQTTTINHSHPNSMLAPPPFTPGATNFPDWFAFNENQVPPVYKQIFDASLLDGQISTDRLYPILLLSGLPREKLAHLWSMCNTGTPGLLVKTELWLILALIALTQNNYDSSQVNILTRCPVPPIPVFSTGQAPATTPTNVEHPQQPEEQSSAPINQMHAIRNPVPQKPGVHSVIASIQPPAQVQLSPSIVPTTVAASSAPVEDDFADFQAAPAANNIADQATSNGKDDIEQEESFGEFMVGGSSSVRIVSNAHAMADPLDFPPYLPPRHCDHRSSMGNGHIPSGASAHHLHPKLNQDHHHQQQQQQQQQVQLHEQAVSRLNAYKAEGNCENVAAATTGKLETPSDMSSLSTMCLEDKYSGNVRSFFCSSDSSTGHTSPSFEYDDFTDGRDSFSQVSTSEQSEIDDIHNFEHYVEEFNHGKKEAAADGSPLHCPFPSVQPNHVHGKSGDTSTSVQAPDQNLAAERQIHIHSQRIPQADLSKLKSVRIPLPGHLATQKASAVHSAVHSSTKPDVDDSDFADFKSASAAAVIPPKGSSGVCNDDRYSALRDLTQDDDNLMQSSVFVEPPTDASAIAGNLSEAGSGIQDGEDDEEWANFAEAPPPPSGDDIDSQNDSGQSFTPSESSPSKIDQELQQTSSVKDGILQLFSTSSTSTPNISNMSSSVSEGINSMVNSDSGYSTKSLGYNSSDHLSSMFESSPTSHPNNQPTGDTKDMTEGSSFWSQAQNTDSGIESNWACFGSQETGAGLVGNSAEIMSKDEQGKSPNLVQSSSMPVMAMMTTESPDQDDWGDFSHMTSSSSSSFTAVGNSNNMELNLSQGVFSGSSDSKLSDHHHSDIVASSDGDWADFSTASSQNDVTGDMAMDANGANMVTIKKQNLGTNEIMGLFKVRDDPATLSAYQLPPQTPPKKKMSRSRKSSKHSRSGSSSHGRRISSDLDDDMVPPPMDSDPEDADDDHAFSRGYDLDDFIQRPPPATMYNPFGSTSSPVYSRATGKTNLRLKESKEDSGSVNSLELPSAHQAFDGNGQGDSQSTSSMEMGTGHSGMVSEESKSLDSLDFKSSEYTETVDESGKEDPRSSTPNVQKNDHHHHHPIQPQDLLSSMPQLVDRYNIDGDAQGNDRYSHEWERCLDSCCDMLTKANTMFNNISSSAVCNEVLKSLQGWEYVSCMIEIYRVGCRIMTAMRSTAISSNQLEQTLKEIDLMWNNLSAFLVGASLLPDPSSLVFTDAILESDKDTTTKPMSACGLCLLNVDMLATTTSTATTMTTATSLSLSSSLLSSLSSSSSTLPSACIGNSISSGISSKLTFAGRHYHSTCANFWVNCVDQTLPSLVQPELL